jgi:hypothetical protein
MKRTANQLEQKEAKQMTKYYLRVGRYFLSTAVLTGFGVTMGN